ncbi:reverse transcriptase/maturase family protein [Virgibacillus salexigens]|uniref:Maturase n=1 Tax=Virgibacillus kapii TaxID=1638645 RepID=A0ABQ2DJ55_9BACI|nr:reverse transcriptase/maturase family protein [Virgibacillus kapii]GGJ57380.1 maturase [Virgibacillus kapii]
MQNPETILGILEKNTKRENYVFQNLYKILYNPDMYLNAYSKLYPNQGNMTQGTDGGTIDGLGLKIIYDLINDLKNESYKPSPSRRIYIPKANGKLRPLGIPSFRDKLLQEVVRTILDTVYEPHFTDTSHGFRPNRSCKTLLSSISKRCSGTKWWIEGDIKGFFDNIDHHVLISILRKTVKDEKFIRLMWKFLNAGYIEDWKYQGTYSGTPQGGIISPILSNIYLHELDKQMEKLKNKYTVGNSRKPSTRYRTIQTRVYMARKKLKENNYDNEEEKEALIKRIKDNTKILRGLPSKEPQDPNFKRFQYFRYADDFLISLIGSKKDAMNIKQEIYQFLKNELKLELSLEKTLVTNAEDRVRFLGYDIVVSNQQFVKKTSNGRVQRHLVGTVQLLLPHEKMRDFLLKTATMKIVNGYEWKAVPRRSLTNNDDLEIISTYNSEIRGLYNYYDIANNVHKLNHAFGIFKKSYLKTLGHKYRTRTTKFRKHNKKYKFLRDGAWGITYTNKKGEEVFRPFYNEGFKRKTKTTSHNDTLPSNKRNMFRTSLTDRIKANKCEWCETTEDEFEVHHVRKLKDLKGRKKWERKMIARQRKTMVLCKKCHKDLHLGKLD